ncbi:hypothetical protein [Granulicella mallensis]|uniref:Uncharacterized protein n=1 Tax=Granulicella mallensis TaxID=940614 RepID=A0A7W7ZTS6_9BACT|nr:hypothetical protein [Granulicella mallensis]MBB5066015.1 hypothetical protein [Granulicella mallensis]
MNTYVVTPPSGAGDPFEVKAHDHWVSKDNIIIFADANNETVATYLAHPGTLVIKK